MCRHNVIKIPYSCDSFEFFQRELNIMDWLSLNCHILLFSSKRRKRTEMTDLKDIIFAKKSWTFEEKFK